MGHFDGKVVVITGAGGGIGRAHALYFAKEGAKIVVNDLGGARDGAGNSQSMADTVVLEIKTSGGEAIANYDSVSTREGAEAIIGTALSTFGRVDVLVNNAGILRDKTMLKMDEAMFDSVIAVHLKGTWLCTQAAARAMVEQGTGGAIVNTTSVAGLKGNFGQTNYSAAKAGIYGITLTAAQELMKFGITVNAVAPIAKTRMTEDLSVVPDDLTAEHISPVVAFLASDPNLTGRILGAHGEHVFAYEMKTSDGVRRSDWSIDSLRASFDELTGAAPARATTTTTAPQPAADLGPAEKIAAVFQRMPAGFLPEQAKGWNAVMHFVIASGGNFTVKVADGACTTAPTLEGKPTCEVKVDVDTFLGMIDGSVDGQQAFMQGKVTATNLADMMKYRTAFSKEKAAAAATAVAATPAPSTPSAPVAASTSDDPMWAVFERMPAGLVKDKAAGWKAVMHFDVAGTDGFTVAVKDGACETHKGFVGTATCVVKTDRATFLGMVDGSVDGQQAFMQGKVTATNLSDMMKYKGAFSKEQAAAAKPQATAAGTAAAPATASAKATATLDGLDTLERVHWIFRLKNELFPSETRALRFELTDDGVHTVGAGDFARVRCDSATLCAFLAGDLDVAMATAWLQLVTTRMKDLMWFKDTLVARDWQQVVAKAVASRPVSVTAEYKSKVFVGAPIVVTSEHAALYAQATDDHNAAYESGRWPLVPPMLAVRYHHELAKQALTDPGIEVSLLRLVFGEQEMSFSAPIHVGDVLSPRCELASIEHKESGSLLRYRFRLLREGELVNESFSTYFVRGEKKAASKDAKKDGASKSTLEIDSPTLTASFTLRPDQSRDYANASLDNNPIHVDDNVAKAAGFKGIINHGLGTLALTARTLVNERGSKDPAQLRAVRGRFSAPVLMGDTLTVRAREHERDGQQGLSFEVVNQDGVPVVTGGFAVLHPRA